MPLVNKKSLRYRIPKEEGVFKMNEKKKANVTILWSL